ncbi:MAG TPA: isochorismatase family cysteine hydrolase [Solirubrobacterales bacterium]|jgi:ureidoacrylate peracid hydrolase
MTDNGLPQYAIDAVLARRGGLHMFEDAKASDSVLIIIDMQEFACAVGSPVEIPAAREVVPALNKLTAACRASDVPVIWVKHQNMAGGHDWHLFFDRFLTPETKEATIAALAPGSPALEVYHELEVDDGDLVVNKNRFSAMVPGASTLDRLLRSLGRRTLIVGGTKTNICCESTARDAMMMDYNVLFLSDGTAALTPDEHEAALGTVLQNFGDVVSTDEVIDRLNLKAGAVA